MLGLIKFFKGIKLEPKAASEISAQGEFEVLNTDGKARYHNGTSVSPLVTEAHTASFTNKSFDANGTGNSISNIEVADLASGVLDTDLTSTSGSDDTLPSAKATKAYADSVSGGVQTNLANHINDTTDAHAASAITNTPSGNLAATEVQAALNELQSDIDTRITNSLLSGKIYVGNGSNVATAQTVSGDISISNAGVVDITAGSIVNNDINASAAIARSKLGTGTASHVVINDGSGNFSSEATLAKSRGGSGQDNSSLTFPASGTLATLAGSESLTNKTITGASIVTPTRLDVKQDTKANLVTYASTASNGQIVFATDEKLMYQVVDTLLVGVGGNTVTFIAGESFAANTSFAIRYAVSGETAGRLYKADQDATTTDKFKVVAFAMSTSAVSAGQEISAKMANTIATLGSSDATFASGDIGKAVYLTASGAFSTTAPTTANYATQQVGIVATTSTMFVQPQFYGIN